MSKPNVLFSNIKQVVLKTLFNCAEPQRAYEFFLQSVARGATPTIKDAELLLQGLLKHSVEERAIQFFNSLSDYDLKPLTSTYNLLIEYYLREQRSEEARTTFKRMEEKGQTPDQITYLHFISHFISKADYKAADKITAFMKAKKVPVNIRFYNGLLQLMIRRQTFDEAEKVIAEMRQAGVTPNYYTYDLLLSMLMARNQMEKIQEIISEMNAIGLSPSTKTYNKMLQSINFPLTPAQTREFLLSMSKQGLTFNSYTYASLIANLLRQKRYREAMEMIFELERKDVCLAIESYGNLLHLCADERLDPAVRALWAQLQRHKIVPNSYILSTMIKYYLLKRNYSGIDSILLRMKREWHQKPNPFVFTALMNYFVEILDLRRLRELLGEIKEAGMEINSVMYNVLMKVFYAYSRYQQGGYLWRMHFALPSINPDMPLPQDVDLTPLPSSHGHLRPADLDLMRTQFERIFGLPFRVNVHIYNEILLSLLMRERFDEMKACVMEMRSKDIALNQTTFTFLIKARIFAGDTEGARQMLGEIHLAGLKPTILQCALVFHCYCRKLLVEEAERFLQEMESIHHLKPNHVFFASLIYAYSRRREYDRVFRVFERMEQDGFTPDTETCNYILISLLEVGEFTEAQKFFEKMLLQGIKRNHHTYNYLVRGFLMRGEDANFISLLGDCIMPGNTVDTAPFNNLLRHYYAADQEERVLSTLLLMNDYCVQYDRDTAPFIAMCMQRFLGDVGKLPVLAKIMRKTLVDFSEDSLGTCELLYRQLEETLVEANLETEVAELRSVRDRLPELRQFWTNINMNTIETFSAQFNGADETASLDEEGIASAGEDPLSPPIIVSDALEPSVSLDSSTPSTSHSASVEPDETIEAVRSLSGATETSQEFLIDRLINHKDGGSGARSTS